LIENWDGKAWTLAANSQPAAADSARLYAISCPSPTACTAVGHSGNSNNQRTLTETWDGTRWTITPSTSPDNTGARLFGVSCPTALDCTAVGDTGSGSSERSLIETWNGTNWTTSSSPNTAQNSPTRLLGISCATTTACTAVGDHGPPDHLEPLTENMS